ncbi:MAG: mechanosensitive ion channel family protein [Clostridiales bacterium]|nr:mechanosensitive ion channel family protein [Clostridiales bacterium]MBR6483530.1 mechanosensitive ion channel family protein [Clostridiales bacterium]
MFDKIVALLSDPAYELLVKLIYIAFILIMAFLAIKILKAIGKRIFKRASGGKKSLHLTFFEKIFNSVVTVAVIILAVSAFAGAKSVWTTVLGGTSVVLAVVTFAAQDVIKDFTAGLMISMYRPFDIGDRIELENGVAGIVEGITMRHVVIATTETFKEIIPNHVINSMALVNCSYGHDLRSVRLQFPVSYDTDVKLAKQLIAEIVEKNPHTVPGKKGYSQVYFSSYADSALMLSVAVYYEKTPTEVIKDEINSAVCEIFERNEIEIPYTYINIVDRKSQS